VERGCREKRSSIGDLHLLVKKKGRAIDCAKKKIFPGLKRSTPGADTRDGSEGRATVNVWRVLLNTRGTNRKGDIPEIG